MCAMRVLGFCDYFSADATGGTEHVTRQTYGRLRRGGADMRIISAVPGGTPGDQIIDGIPTRVVPARSLARLVRAEVAVAPGLSAAASRLVADFAPDVIHAAGLHSNGARVAASLARRRAIPLVTTLHLGSIDALPPITRIPTGLYEQTVGRRILSASERVIAVSRAAAAHATSLGAGDVDVVLNGVDADKFTPGPKASSGPVGVVFVGRLIANKGPDTALTAFAAIDPGAADLTFVGEGPMRPRLERRVRNLGLGTSVRFLGRVTDVASVLAPADILIRPSTTEGRSLAILEAMSAGVCVIASDIDANRELIEDGTDGMLHRVGDAADLERRLREVIEHAEKRYALADSGRTRALRSSWDDCAAATGQILFEVSSGMHRS